MLRWLSAWNFCRHSGKAEGNERIIGNWLWHSREYTAAYCSLSHTWLVNRLWWTALKENAVKMELTLFWVCVGFFFFFLQSEYFCFEYEMTSFHRSFMKFACIIQIHKLFKHFLVLWGINTRLHTYVAKGCKMLLSPFITGKTNKLSAQEIQHFNKNA